MPECKILMTQEGSTGVMKVVGIGTFQSAAVFKAGYLQLMASGVSDFIVDLGGCPQLDSTFLGIILGLALKLRQQGTGQVHIIHPNDMIRSVFRGSGLDQIFDMS